MCHWNAIAYFDYKSLSINVNRFQITVNLMIILNKIIDYKFFAQYVYKRNAKYVGISIPYISVEICS